MDKKYLSAYRTNRKRIERLEKLIEDEQFRDIPAVAGVVKGSSHTFPYIERRFGVELEDPKEAAASKKKIRDWKMEKEKAEKEMKEVEKFVEGIENIDDREIFRTYYMYGEKRKSQTEIADIFNYERSSISKRIAKYL